MEKLTINPLNGWAPRFMTALLIPGFLCAGMGFGIAVESNLKTLVEAGKFRKIYDPGLGESQPWYINDHCFIQVKDSLWHMFGVTHEDPAGPHQGIIFAHAIAKTLLQEPWQKQPFALTVATIDPWGLHYERTQTWWEMSGAWHEYLTRCQYMLRQGWFVANLCYLRPQRPNQNYFTPVPAGFEYEECSAEALMARMSVKDGRLVLPDGMSYRLLVLPAELTLMTPALVRKIKQLVEAGATVLGPRPTASPSLANFAKCDEEITHLANEVWGDCDGKAVTEHVFGKGRVIWGQQLEKVLAQLPTPPDFTASAKLNWIHLQIGDQQVCFVAHQTVSPVEAKCHFRVKGLRPELWDTETGEISPLAVYEETATGISVPLWFEASGSVFVVFRPQQKRFASVVSFTRDGQSAVTLTKPPVIVIQKTSYGVPGDAQRTRDVKTKVQKLVDRGEVDFEIAKLPESDDSAYGTAKILVVEYTAADQSFKISGQDTAALNWVLPIAAVDRVAEVRSDTAGRLLVVARQPGKYEVKTASGKTRHFEIKSMPAVVGITGEWEVAFPPKWGAPAKISSDHLYSLSDSTNAGVKYFSGKATYTKTFAWNPAAQNRGHESEIWLDLGEVQVMAQLKLNGHNLGTLWKPPFRVNVAHALKSGQNALVVRVANLWPNRMIGDAGLPAVERFTWITFEPFTEATPLPKSGLLGPVNLYALSEYKELRITVNINLRSAVMRERQLEKYCFSPDSVGHGWVG